MTSALGRICKGANRMLKKFTRAERGWIMYDWANSAFAAIISAIILPNFYGQLTAGNLAAGA